MPKIFTQLILQEREREREISTNVLKGPCSLTNNNNDECLTYYMLTWYYATYLLNILTLYLSIYL